MNALSSISAMTSEEFDQIVAIARRDAGLSIPKSKMSLVQSRVARRIRAIGVSDYGAYLERLQSDLSEHAELISALTTNVSQFYREDHHFAYLAETILARSNPERLRFWSAGCSNGQEPYTLAFEILRLIPDAADRDILVLASDIDPKVLQKAKAGVYKTSEIDGVPEARRKEFFTSPESGHVQVRSEIANLVRFRHLNLNASPWPMRGPFDAILCRNVVIYFDESTQRTLWPRFSQMMQTGGLLMLGHSERINPVEGSGFESVGVTTYRKL